MANFVSLAGLSHIQSYSLDVTPIQGIPNQGMYVLQINLAPSIHVVQLPTMDSGDTLPLMSSINIVTKIDPTAPPTQTLTAYLGVDVIPPEGIEKNIDINFWELNEVDQSPLTFIQIDSDAPLAIMTRKNPKKVVYKKPVPSVIVRVIRTVINWINRLFGHRN